MKQTKKTSRRTTKAPSNRSKKPSNKSQKKKDSKLKDKKPVPKKPPKKGAGPPPAWKVYVSGFHDWPASPNQVPKFNKWLCKDNPSGLLILGNPYFGETKPTPTGGPLPRVLSAITQTANGRPIEWTFDTLPVQWGVGNTIRARSYDVVINIGLGVKVSAQTTIKVERGARNSRATLHGATGKLPGTTTNLSTTIDSNAGTNFPAPTAIRNTVNNAVNPITVGNTTYRPKVAPARASNNYICNETHSIMLSKIRPNARLRQAYFIHIPEPPNAAGRLLLARALKTLIERLIQP